MATLTSYAGQLAPRVSEFRDLGHKEATKHRPATTASHPDSNEVALRSQAEQLLANEQTLFDAIVADADRAAHDANSSLIELRSDIAQALADNTIETQVDAELAGDRAKLVDLTAHRIRAEVEWRGFRATNGITDMPSYPDSLIWHWAIIICLVFVETIANAFFYKNSNGLLGGFMVAAGVAAVNMGSAAGLGSLFRRKNLADPVQKYFGWACLLIFLPLTFFCNALFSAFRSIYETILDPSDGAQLRDAFRTAWGEATRIFAFDFHFGDFASFLLFMTGFILSCLAFWKGYTSDDPYPGYSKRDRALKKARADENAAQALVKQRLKDLLLSHRNRVQGLAGQTGTLITMLSHRLGAVGHAQRALTANAAAIERDYHLLLDSYRQANLAVRGTEPPSYFTDLPNITTRVKTEAAAPAEAQLREVLGTVEAIQGQHRDDLNNKLNALQEQMSAILSTTYDRFIREVEGEAEVSVQKDIQVMPAAQ
jgi:hypothetical protein